ncbi:MAG: tetratricopeptide repeat protein [Myxococcales bacterium]|nr:tetratricopeptide repeat protein [Myxococcales bacterium]MCB9734832.1 tetratricopeptide repeat protein [Deltaproteobacteria bacterium]
MKKKDLAIDLLDMALARRNEPAALATALIALDRLTQARPDHARAHYASGRVLLLMGQHQLALGAFRVALGHDAEHAASHYWEGVALWLLGRPSEALSKVLNAVFLDPTFFDARFDAGQLFFQHGDREAALEQWKAALELRPDDFGTLRKVLQCLLALGYYGTADITHQRLKQVWLTSADPAVRAVRSYVLDQFKVGDLHVLAVESLAVETDPAVLFAFPVSHEGRLAFTVNLETSAALRVAGSACVVTVVEGDVRFATDVRYAEVPGYHVLKPTVLGVIRRHAGVSDEVPAE